MSFDFKHMGDYKHWFKDAERRLYNPYLNSVNKSNGTDEKNCPSKGKRPISETVSKPKSGSYLEPKASYTICREIRRVKIYDMTNSPYIWGNECRKESQYSAIIRRTTSDNVVKAYNIEIYDCLEQLQCTSISVCKDADIVYTNGYFVIKDENGVTIFSLASKMVRRIEATDVIYVGRGFFAYKKDNRVYLTLVGNTSFEDGKGIEASGNELNGLYQTHIGIPYANPTDKPWIIVEFGGKIYAVSADKNDRLDYVNLSDYKIEENGPIVRVGMDEVVNVEKDDVNDERLGNAIADIISKMPNNEKFLKKICDEDIDNGKTELKEGYHTHVIDKDSTPKISTKTEETLKLHGSLLAKLWEAVYGLPLEY